MKTSLLTLGIVGLLQTTSGLLLAEKAYPMLMSLKPTAAQRGSTSEHELESRYSMFGAYQVLVSGEGVTGEIVTPMDLGKDGKEPSLTKINVKFTVADDALPGVRDVRVVGPTGASTLGQLVITTNPVIYEQDKNNQPDGAQVVSIPSTLCGAIEAGEDVDYFKLTISEPQTINFHCWGMRLEDRIHDLQTHVDPIITVKNAATGATVAAANNDFAADPFLSHDFKHPGDYLLEVRDVRYGGNKYWQYAIEVSHKPFVTQVYPVGLPIAAATHDLEPVGAGLPGKTHLTVALPEGTSSAALRDVSTRLGDDQTNPVSVVFSNLPCITESVESNNTPQEAQSVDVPNGINGRIESPGDIDCYRFAAQKGDRVSVEVFARRNHSQLDSIVRILKEDGASLVENDDLREWGRFTYQDSEIENWVAPADGNYVIEIRDVHLRGGESYVYFLNVDRPQPYFELALDSDKTWISPGGCGVIFARAVKKNGFDGEIQLHIDGLPEGVTAQCGRILPGKANDGCIILQAARDANLVASNIRITGTATMDQEGQPLELVTVAQPMQETYMPGGGRSHWPVEMHTVAVGAPADILDLKLSTTEIVLKPGESKRVDIEIQRAEGFNTNVTLDMLYRHLNSVYANSLPEGVTIDARQSKTLLTGKETRGHITLTAAKEAPPVTEQQCSVMANVSLNFVMKATYSSVPVKITVASTP
ncbi:MAG: hypothetical protein KDA90_17840 [Planctomycetaceae bacterium]|nr:hypothetical protein [Planctomycetaceae bacterium]